MSDSFVRVSCDLYFRAESLPSWYRLYINDELFVERDALIDSHQAIRETLTFSSRAGRYLLWARGDNQEKIAIKHVNIIQGAASVEDNRYIRIE
jgi:hypothetical protein